MGDHSHLLSLGYCGRTRMHSQTNIGSGKQVSQGGEWLFEWAFAYFYGQVCKKAHNFSHSQGGTCHLEAFSPNGKYVISGSYDKTARVWEAATGKEIARMTKGYM